MSEKEYDAGSMIGHFPCIANEVKGKKECHSSDAMACYEHEGNEDTNGEVYYDAYCYSCNQSFTMEQTHNSSMGGELGVEGGVVVDRKPFEKKPKANPLDRQEVIDFIKSTGYNSNDYRGIKDEFSQFFGHLTKLDKEGEVLARYYPETKNGKVTGYKCRNAPKDFRYGKLGLTGLSCELSGQIKFKDYKNHRDILIVGGEEDKTAAFQMLRENQIRKGQADYAPMAVVSPTTGESSAIKQIRAQYDFLNQFENIILGLDNDEVGKEAMLEIAEILPKEKVKLVYWSGKDPNAMLQKGKEKQFMSDFYNAKPFIKDGVLTSVDADDTIEKELLRPKMSLPDFMSELQRRMAGGVPIGYMVNWIAESGIGKSTLINEAIRHWVYTSPYKVGILSLELTGAQYMIAMLSREVGYKINLIEDPQEAVKFVQQPHVMEARKHLTTNEYGEDRFVILDQRDGELDEVKKQCERLISKYGCEVLIIDPIQDLFEGVDMQEQTSFVKWMKNIMKRGITFHNVCHVRKGANSTNKDGKRIRRELTEDDVHGISSIVKSGGANVFMSRDKYAEDEIEKNTTSITMGKCRWSGITGRCGDWYYDLKSHTMHDKATFFENEGIANEELIKEDIMDRESF